jgi:hypothetical protein
VFTTLSAMRGCIGDERTSRRVFFSATRRPVVLSLALYTFPYVPCPIFSSFSYASLMEWPIFAVFDVEAP